MRAVSDTNAKIDRFTSALSQYLLGERDRFYAPDSKKSFTRIFTTNDLVRLLGIPDSTLRTMTNEGKGPQPARLENNRRAYSLEQVWQLRQFLAEQRPEEALSFQPWRRRDEKLQVLACTNFKGGSSKTTSSLHLAHYLALQGYRVLCIDLDPQASLTGMFGLQPEFEVGENETAYAALRYDTDRLPLSSVIRPTYFSGISLVPGNLELMEFEHDTARMLGARQRDELGLFFVRLNAIIDQVGENFDVVVLDTPPSLGFTTLAALFAATSLIVTVHPSMLDIASMNQYLIMIQQLTSGLEEHGGVLRHDWLRFLITRHTPNDGPQVEIVARLRTLFGDHVLVAAALESTSVGAAGLAKKSLYELEPGDVGRETLKRALESMDAVNGEILSLIRKTWGRA